MSVPNISSNGVHVALTLHVIQVDFVSSPIKKFTATGIETEDGKTQDLDLVFCATGTPPSHDPCPISSLTLAVYTGFDASWQLPFKIIGRNGVDLNTKWKPHPTSYLSMCVDGFPNMFMSLGPNSVIGAGVLLPVIEAAVGYAVQATAKMQRERFKSMEVKLRAVQDFDRYIEVRGSGAVRSLRRLATNVSVVRAELLPAGEWASISYTERVS